MFRYIYLVLSVYEGTVTPIIWTCLGSHRRTVYRISCPHGCVHALVVEVRVVAGTRYLVGVCDQVLARRGGRKLQPAVRLGVPSGGAASAFRTATSSRGPATAGTAGATSLSIYAEQKEPFVGSERDGSRCGDIRQNEFVIVVGGITL